MTEISGETTMEDILASIKKIIAEEPAPAPSPRAFRRDVSLAAPVAPKEDVLDLVEQEQDVEPIVSEKAVSASRTALEALNVAAHPPVPARGATVEDLASELLRPMLKDWLDSHLPAIVERLVAKEVARITGRD